jgi:hypothetical protein
MNRIALTLVTACALTACSGAAPQLVIHKDGTKGGTDGFAVRLTAGTHVEAFTIHHEGDFDIGFDSTERSTQHCAVVAALFDRTSEFTVTATAASSPMNPDVETVGSDTTRHLGAGGWWVSVDSRCDVELYVIPPGGGVAT